MNKRLPCYIVSDLLPLYQDDILSEQTKKDIDKHLTECRECQKKMAAMKTQLDIQNTNVDLKINPLKKVRFYQKILTVLGAVIAFILGACIPIAILGFTVLERGEIAAYQIERVKGLWYVLTSWSCASGIVVCVIYFLLILLIKKIIKKKVKIISVFPDIKIPPYRTFIHHCPIWGGIISVKAAALKSVNKEATSTPRQIQLPQGLSYIPYSFLCPT